jgi:hypothetical protein
MASLTIISNTLFLYEPFNYTNIGQPVSSNTPANWSYNVSAAPNDCNVTSGNLSYLGLASGIGNSVTNGGVGLGVRRLWGTNINGGTIYFSTLFRMNALGIGTWDGNATQIASLQDSGNNARYQILVRVSGSGYQIGLQKSGTGSTSVFDTTEYHAGDTVFLVGKYDFTTSPNAAYFWINPAASTFGGSDAVTGSLTRNDGTNNTGMDRFNMRQNTATSVPAAMQWDELRFGFSWADVTPLLNAVAPQITAQPTNQICSVGSNATFTVTATGTAPLNFQWHKRS